MLRLEQALVQLQEPALGLELELEPALGLELVQELAAVLKRVREPRVSRQQEPQQHRLLAAAQELSPYLPALPMKALC